MNGSLCRLFHALLLLALIPGTTTAQTPTSPEVRAGVEAYERGELQAAEHVLAGVREGGLTARDRAILFLYRGLLSLAFGDEEEALERFRAAVRADPSVSPDPAVHSPNRRELYARAVADVEAERREEIRGPYGMAFVRIPAGSFRMGDITGSGQSDERPVHTVSITEDFYLQTTEVTQGQWRAVMGTNPSHFDDCGDSCPVERVSWHDIQEFIRKLNDAKPGAKYRLPTEAEWEYAARARTTGEYGGTGVLDEMGWYQGNSGDRTHSAAQKQPNAWGLYDMHGNVWEWVQDWYSSSYYSMSPTNDPQGPASGSRRVLRGGSWSGSASGARAAVRSNDGPSFRVSRLGFRLARIR